MPLAPRKITSWANRSAPIEYLSVLPNQSVKATAGVENIAAAGAAANSS